MQGVNPEIYWDSSTECINNVVFIIDDFTYLVNNASYLQRWEDPVLNLTALVAGNMSDSLLNCYLFGTDFWYETQLEYSQFGGFSDYLIAFIFKQLGNAGTFRDILDKIQTAEEN